MWIFSLTAVADSKTARQRRAPYRSKFFQFHAVFGNNLASLPSWNPGSVTAWFHRMNKLKMSLIVQKECLDNKNTWIVFVGNIISPISGRSRIFVSGLPTPKVGVACKFFGENCMKMKEFGPRGWRPWRPPCISQCPCLFIFVLSFLFSCTGGTVRHTDNGKLSDFNTFEGSDWWVWHSF